jgi:acyl carrier protein
VATPIAEADVLGSIAEVARAHLNWTGPLSRDMPLVETFELDSLRQLTLVIEIENRFRIRLDDQDEASLCTVGDLLDVIRRKVAGAAAHDR